MLMIRFRRVSPPLESDSTLTVSLMDLTVEDGRYGISAEAYAGNSLVITLSNVIASGPGGAIHGFTSGIDQLDCTLLLPEEGQISKGTVMDGEKPRRMQSSESLPASLSPTGT